MVLYMQLLQATYDCALLKAAHIDFNSGSDGSIVFLNLCNIRSIALQSASTLPNQSAQITRIPTAIDWQCHFLCLVQQSCWMMKFSNVISIVERCFEIRNDLSVLHMCAVREGQCTSIGPASHNWQNREEVCNLRQARSALRNRRSASSDLWPRSCHQIRSPGRGPGKLLFSSLDCLTLKITDYTHQAISCTWHNPSKLCFTSFISLDQRESFACNLPSWFLIYVSRTIDYLFDRTRAGLSLYCEECSILTVLVKLCDHAYYGHAHARDRAMHVILCFISWLCSTQSQDWITWF